MKRPDIDPLLRLIEQGSRKAQSIGGEVLVSHSQTFESVDLLMLFTALESVTSDRWYWEHPEEDRTIVSLGILSAVTPPRNVRFPEVDRVLKQYAARSTVQDDTPESGGGPLFHVAFSFDPYVTQDRLVWQSFPSTYLLTPRITIVRDGSSFTLTQNAFVGPNLGAETIGNAAHEFNESVIKALDEYEESKLIIDELPPDKTNEQELRQFLQAVSAATASVRNEEFDILNLVRRLKLTTGGLYRLNRVLTYLRGRFPHSRLVAAGRHGSSFLGLADDLLIGKTGNVITSTTATGFIRRGDSPELDEALAAQLVNTPEKVEHHELCVDHIYEVFEAHCSEIDAPDDPEIRSTPEQHHLYSTVTGSLTEGITLMDVIRELHPAVHVSGAPGDEVVEKLRKMEEIDRGWAGAPVGWVNLQGDGEFVCTTRSAIVRAPVLHQQRAFLFATTPVYSGSDPEDLVAQSEDAIDPLRTALRK